LTRNIINQEFQGKVLTLNLHHDVEHARKKSLLKIDKIRNFKREKVRSLQISISQLNPTETFNHAESIGDVQEKQYE
jgi:hypothetical protein